jgi:hypothetical protein
LISVGAIPTLAILDDLTLTDCNNCFDVAVSGSTAFVIGTNDASTQGAITAVSISSPAALSETSVFTSATLTDCAKVVVSGSHAFVGAGNEVVAVDISNPASMSIADSVAIPNCVFITSAAIVGSYLFCTAVINADDDAVVAIDISDPMNLAISGDINDASLNFAGSLAAH